MIVFPNCKINLGLSIIEKRDDGYHNLETFFYPLAINDIVEIIPAPKSEYARSDYTDDLINFTTSGLKVDGNTLDNLCLKACNLLQKNFPRLPFIKLHLHKVIPMGAGLGGGSADAAFVLSLLNDQFRLGLSLIELIGYAVTLGSDCPFFIINEPCFASGRGEILERVALDMSSYYFVLVNAGIRIDTGWAFSQLKFDNNRLEEPAESIKEIIQRPVTGWKDSLINHFEKPVFKKYPEIASIKNKLYAHGAVYTAMTGSGSTVYGIFEKELEPVFDFPNNYWVKKVKAWLS